jgi:hypothetical protein
MRRPVKGAVMGFSAHQRVHQLGGAHIGWRAGAVGFVAQALALLDLKALRAQVGQHQVQPRVQGWFDARAGGGDDDAVARA